MTENLTPERHEGLHEGASDAGATRVTAPADGGAGATRVAAPADDAARTTVVPPCAEAAAAVPDATLPAPVPSPAATPLPEADELREELRGLGARVKRLRTAVVVLACIAVLLAGAVGALAWSVWGPSDPSTPQTEVGVVGGSSVGSSGSADASGSHDVGGTSGSGAAADDADEDDVIDPDNLRAADLLAIVGENWANAQRILASYGVDQADLVLITDDGGMVLNPSNWTVTLVADLDEPGTVAVYLRHDSHSIF